MNLQERLGQVQALKETFDIGTSSAYYYLKSQDAYRELYDFFREQARESGLDSQEKDLAEFTSFVESFEYFLSGLASQIGKYHAETHIGGELESLDVNIWPYGVSGDLRKKEYQRVYEQYGDETTELNLELDRRRFIEEYCKHIGSDNSIPFYEREQEFFKYLIDSEVKLFDDGEGQYSIKDLLNSPDLFLYENEYADEFYSEHDEEDSAPIILDGVGILDKARGKSDDPWFQLAYTSYFYKLHAYDSFSPSAREFLFNGGLSSNGLYERLEREGRTRDIHSERKIGMSILLDYSVAHPLEVGKDKKEDKETEKQIEEFMGEVVEQINESISRAEESLESVLNSIEGVVENPIADHFKHRIQERKYHLRAIEGNRKWLKKELVNFFVDNQFVL